MGNDPATKKIRLEAEGGPLAMDEETADCLASDVVLPPRAQATLMVFGGTCEMVAGAAAGPHSEPTGV